MTDERIAELWALAEVQLLKADGEDTNIAMFTRLVERETARECAEIAEREHDVWLTPMLKTVAKHIADAIRRKFGEEDA